MPDREKKKKVEISGRDARQGEIILRSKRRRLIFIAGLVGIVVLVLIVRFAA